MDWGGRHGRWLHEAGGYIYTYICGLELGDAEGFPSASTDGRVRVE